MESISVTLVAQHACSVPDFLSLALTCRTDLFNPCLATSLADFTSAHHLSLDIRRFSWHLVHRADAATRAIFGKRMGLNDAAVQRLAVPLTCVQALEAGIAHRDCTSCGRYSTDALFQSRDTRHLRQVLLRRNADADADGLLLLRLLRAIVQKCSQSMHNLTASPSDADAIAALLVSELLDAGICEMALAIAGSCLETLDLYDAMARHAPAHVLAAVPLSLTDGPEERTLSPRLLAAREDLSGQSGSLLSSMCANWRLDAADAPFLRTVAAAATCDDLLEALRIVLYSTQSECVVVAALLDEIAARGEDAHRLLDAGVATQCLHLAMSLRPPRMSQELVVRLYELAAATADDARSAVIFPRLFPSTGNPLSYENMLPLESLRDLLSVCDAEVMSRHELADSLRSMLGAYDISYRKALTSSRDVAMFTAVFSRSFEVGVVPNAGDLMICMKAGIDALATLPFPPSAKPALATELLLRMPSPVHMRRLVELGADPQRALSSCNNVISLRVLLECGALIDGAGGDGEPLSSAIRRPVSDGRRARVKRLIDAGARIDLPSVEQALVETSATPAIARRGRETLQKLAAAAAAAAGN